MSERRHVSDVEVLCPKCERIFSINIPNEIRLSVLGLRVKCPKGGCGETFPVSLPAEGDAHAGHHLPGLTPSMLRLYPRPGH